MLKTMIKDASTKKIKKKLTGCYFMVQHLWEKMVYLKKLRLYKPNILKQQLNLVENWYATDSSGVCSQLPLPLKPTLVIVGAEANSLILAEKILGSWLVQIKGGGYGLMCQYPEQFSKIEKTLEILGVRVVEGTLKQYRKASIKIIIISA